MYSNLVYATAALPTRTKQKNKTMKQLLLFALFLALPALASAQCFTAYRDAGKAHVQKKEYDKAIEKFNKAKGCLSDKPANGDREIDALIADAKKRRQTRAKRTQNPATAKPNPADTTRCADCPEMVSVTGGSITMGCKNSIRDGECYDKEKPPHEVTVRDFYIGKYEVTQAEWLREMGSNPSYFKDFDNCPVENVSWNDVQEYIKKLNARTGKTYRLPTEAEWEYAARGGSRSQGYWYSGSNTLADVGWYEGNSGRKTKPVGTRKANELGIYDMSGNVWEWVEDDWHDNYTGAPTDGRAWVNSSRGSYRVLRGGSWNSAAEGCRAACRSNLALADRYSHVGFRLALQSGG
jgi:formylglycine-generating enzyme required for sulfatase activity